MATLYDPSFTAIHANLTAVFVIEGQPVVMDIQNFDATFPVVAGQSADLPTCIFTVPLGVNATLGVPSGGELIRFLVFQVPVTVIMTIKGTSGNPTGLLGVQEGARYILFQGFVANVQYVRGPEGVALQVYALHWLYALNFSSSLSETSHPKNPADLVFRPLIFSGAGSRGGLTNIDDFQATIGPLNVVTDMWGNAILPWFRSLASTDRINSIAFGFNDSPNRMAYWALSRFIHVPLSVRTDYPESTFVALQISSALSGLMSSVFENSMHHMANKTLWGELTRLADTFYFMVIPLPTVANVAPYVPSLGRWYLPYGGDLPTVFARDIFQLRISTTLQQPIRALGLFGSFTTFAGSGLRSDPASAGTEANIGGVFVSPNLQHGMVMFQPAPFYAATLVNPSVAGPFALLARGNAYRNPGGGIRGPVNLASLRRAQKVLLDNFARYLYNMHVLQGRTGQLVCPLRFDIAPGSTILIEAAGPSFTGPPQFANSAITALVIRVDISVRASERNALARSVFHLHYIRNNFEQMDPAFVMDEHPLYTTVYPGCPMFNGPF